MPSGARTMEHGRPVICGIIQSPTASRYSARSNLVTGFLSPASGQSALSGLLMVTPRTVLGAFAVAAASPAPLARATSCAPADSPALAELPALARLALLVVLAALPAPAESAPFAVFAVPLVPAESERLVDRRPVALPFVRPPA